MGMATDPVIVLLTLDGEQIIEVTPEHPLYVVGKGWTIAEALQVGNQVQQADGTPGTVTAAKVIERPQVMCNLIVDTAHTGALLRVRRRPTLAMEAGADLGQDGLNKHMVLRGL